MNVPVLLVHGLWDSSEDLEPLRAALHRSAITRTAAIDLEPNDGAVGVAALAAQVRAAADALRERYESEKLDVVGFSMGALVSRYYVQRLGGKARVRRYVSIAGPHAGTLTAHFAKLAVAREMRPGSALLRELAGDVDPWSGVEVHCFITPADLMIVPAKSGVLAGAREVRVFPVAMHRWMITDQGVMDAVVEVLGK